MSPISTPVLLITFNRPWHTRQVLKAIGAVQPTELYVFQDGERNASDSEGCAQVRDIVTNTVDWPCNLHKFYSDSDILDQDAMEQAMAGCDFVFHLAIVGGVDTNVKATESILGAAQKAGIKHIVQMSSVGRDRGLLWL